MKLKTMTLEEELEYAKAHRSAAHRAIENSKGKKERRENEEDLNYWQDKVATLEEKLVA